MSKTQVSVICLAGVAVLIGFVQGMRWLIPDALTNEQIVEQTKFCESNGMDAGVTMNGFTYDVQKVICLPKDKATKPEEN